MTHLTVFLQIFRQPRFKLLFTLPHIVFRKIGTRFRYRGVINKALTYFECLFQLALFSEIYCEFFVRHTRRMVKFNSFAIVVITLIDIFLFPKRNGEMEVPHPSVFDIKVFIIKGF